MSRGLDRDRTYVNATSGSAQTPPGRSFASGRSGASSDGTPPPPFTPTDIPGLLIWFDASDASTITAIGNGVSQWNDKSGNVNNGTQGTSASRPQTGVATLNSLNVLRCATTYRRLTLTSPVSHTNGYTLIAVLGAISAGAGTKSLVGGPSGSFDARFNASNAMAIATSGVALRLTGATSSITASGIYTYQSLSSGNTVRIAGVSDGSNATDPVFTTGFTTLFSQVATNPFFGDLGEILVYPGNMTAANQNLLGTYLSAKWGQTWNAI